MNSEIEVKFLNVNFDDLRVQLHELGAMCIQPMRDMRRAIFVSKAMEQQGAYIRLREEGSRTTLTYKQFDEKSPEVEKIDTTVGDFEAMQNILQKAGLTQRAYQESRRENWLLLLDGSGVVLSEWPWLAPFVEIEGPSVESVKKAAERLGFDWNDAVTGTIAQAYEAQYPGSNAGEVTKLAEIKFKAPMPEILSSTEA